MFRPLYSGFPGHVHNAAEPRTNLRLHGDLSLRVFNKCRPLTTPPLRLSQLKRRKKRKHRRGASQLPYHSPSFLRSTASHQLRFENFPTNSPAPSPSSSSVTTRPRVTSPKDGAPYRFRKEKRIAIATPRPPSHAGGKPIRGANL